MIDNFLLRARACERRLCEILESKTVSNERSPEANRGGQHRPQGTPLMN